MNHPISAFNISAKGSWQLPAGAQPPPASAQPDPYDYSGIGRVTPDGAPLAARSEAGPASWWTGGGMS